MMQKAELLNKLKKYFNDSELRNDLCLKLGVDYEDLPGTNMADKARELILYLDRRGRLPELLKLCQQQRPGISWLSADDAARISSIQQKQSQTDLTTILFLAANPTDATRLRLGQESRDIQGKLQLAKERDRFQFEQRWAVRPEDLMQALLDIDPQIVHFSGHGTSEGELCLEDLSGKIHPVKADVLGALFKLEADHLQCVVLNACYSEIQANAIGKYIPYVIGMNQAIGDQAAISFAVGFYQALGGGCSIQEAYERGCLLISLQNIPEYLTPVLITKKG